MDFLRLENLNIDIFNINLSFIKLKFKFLSKSFGWGKLQ